MDGTRYWTKSADHFTNNSKTVLWNGPMGVFSFNKFENGTKSVAASLAEATSTGAYPNWWWRFAVAIKSLIIKIK